MQWRTAHLSKKKSPPVTHFMGWVESPTNELCMRPVCCDLASLEQYLVAGGTKGTWHSMFNTLSLVPDKWPQTCLWKHLLLRFQASTAMCTRSALFPDFKQREKEILYRRLGTTYRSQSWTPWPLKMGRKGPAETSVRKCFSTPRKITEERRAKKFTYIHCLSGPVTQSV